MGVQRFCSGLYVLKKFSARRAETQGRTASTRYLPIYIPSEQNTPHIFAIEILFESCGKRSRTFGYAVSTDRVAARWSEEQEHTTLLCGHPVFVPL